MINNVPIKFINDSGSPVTLILECLFSKVTPTEPLKATYKDVNNQIINFVGQRKATAKTTEETIELPLLITKAQTAPLMGLDWMQRLKFNLSSNNDAIQIHNIKLDNTDRRIRKLQNDFKNSFYNNKRDKNSLSQNKSESRSTNNTTKRTTNPNTFTRPSGTRAKTSNKTRLCAMSNRNYGRLLCKPRSDNSEEREVSKDCSRLY